MLATSQYVLVFIRYLQKTVTQCEAAQMSRNLTTKEENLLSSQALRNACHTE